MENRFIKIACLTILMMGSALQAMDIGQDDLNSQLLRAAYMGDEQQVNQLLKKGADVNARDVTRADMTALMMAIKVGGRSYRKVCELLIAHGVDINARDKDGKTALMIAAGFGDREVCTLLIAHGADFNAQDSYGGWTALIEAANFGHKEICELLIANNAEINAQTHDGQTALMIAAKRGHRDLCELLINAMIKPTKEEIASIVALLGSSKKKRSQQLNITTHDVVKLIGQERYKAFRRLHKPSAAVEINKIEDVKMKQELLDYLDSI